MPFDDDNPPPAIAQNQRRVALVIGNGAYEHASPLANPSSDANAICAKLKGLGFQVFSGVDLGYQVHGKNYLVPVDAKIEGVAELKFSTILFDDILEPMTRLSKAALVFLDACRDNPFARNISRSLGQRNVSGGLAEIKAASGSFIAFATAPDKVAFDGHGDNSPFTTAFLRHVDTPGLSLSDVMIDVRNSVLDETNGKQEPWDQSSLRSRFYFVPEVPKPPVPVAPPVSAELAEADAAWRLTEQSENIGQLTIFRNKYEGTVYADYAEHRINELRAADEKARAELEAKRQSEEEARRRQEQEAQAKELAKKQAALEARQKDDAAFDRARAENSVAAFESYLASYSQGEHVDEAKAAIKELKPSRLKPLLAGVFVVALLVGGIVLYQSGPSNEPTVIDGTPLRSITSRLSFEPEVVPITGGTLLMGGAMVTGQKIVAGAVAIVL